MLIVIQMREVIISVVQDIKLTTEDYDLLPYMEKIKSLMNEILAFAIRNKVTSSGTIYHDLIKGKELGVYKLAVNDGIRRVLGILKTSNKVQRRLDRKYHGARQVKIPYCWKPVYYLHNTEYAKPIKYVDGVLIFPVDAKKNVEIPLNKYVSKKLASSVMINSITLSAKIQGKKKIEFNNPYLFAKCRTYRYVKEKYNKKTKTMEKMPKYGRLSITYTILVDDIQPEGFIALDTNLDNVTMADTNKNVTIYNMAQLNKWKEQKAETVSHFRRNDARVLRHVAGKHGAIEKRRVNSAINNLSKRIVDIAKENKMAIIMEDLSGIRNRYTKENMPGKKKDRKKLNGWSFAEIRRQIEYKADINGVPFYLVDPKGTSNVCAICGGKMKKSLNAYRKLKCSHCHHLVDRDVNASINILKRGISLIPEWCEKETVIRNPMKDLKISDLVIRGVDSHTMVQV